MGREPATFGRPLAHAILLGIVMMKPVVALQVAAMRKREAVTIQQGSEIESMAHDAGASAQQRSMPHGWFGSFSQAESTYDPAGRDAYLHQYPEREAKDGWAPSSPFDTRWRDRNFDFAWFHESPSAAGREAYQAHYPLVSGSVAGNREVRANHWRHTAGSTWDPQGWVQDYVPTHYAEDSEVELEDHTHGASWFDSAVNQFDGYGRPMLPPQELAFLTSEGWVERSVNTSLACKDPGCSASASLQVYDPSTEQATNCRFSFLLKPTDFDGDWSEESVEYITLNGAVATRSCHPGARGCNATAWTPLYHCLRQFPVDHMLASEGRVVVEAKISDMVDECAYQGNLLFGVVAATCMVRPTPSTTLMAERTSTMAPEDAAPMVTSGLLRCSKVSCIARTDLAYNPGYLLGGGACSLTVIVNQTDYDQDESEEKIAFIAVNGVNITTDAAPGSNPCLNEMKGIANKPSDYTFEAIKDKDITAQALLVPGTLNVLAQNTGKVDECASQGFLFDASITMTCTAKK
mmetsp:Transcript_33048/g.77283  ORF Transcript_33048/g.77283 Transcript_33048/m.77283 type:complete len:520 (-) Transcript_33048:42-1601(-)